MNTAKADTKYKCVDQQSATGRFHVPVNMASCVFVRQKYFCQPKTQLALPAGRGVFLQSRKTYAAIKSPIK